MGTIHAPEPAKLILPMFSACDALLDESVALLVEQFGPADLVSARLPFEHTDYYTAEFGSGLKRQFVSFEQLIDPGELASIKVWTNALEQRLGSGGRRGVNLDPGYLTPGKLVLATTKDHGHRIYLGQGIYAEVTLAYRDRDFRPWPWTYPDYRSEPYLCILRAIRARLMAQLRARQG